MNALLDTSLSWLQPYQYPEGGVAYLPGRLPRIEPTVYAALADAARPQDVDWLTSQLPKELFNQPPAETTQAVSPYQVEGRPWLVAASMLALANLPSVQSQLDIAACVKFLRQNHASDDEGNFNVTQLNDTQLAGALPWNFGNYGWIQPTCWAMFAELALLQIAENKQQQKLLLNNLELRIGYLLERKTFDHGWNYGNTAIQGVDIPAHPLETALVLLALGGVKNSPLATHLLFLKFDPEPSFATLKKLSQSEGSRLTHAWRNIAIRCWQKTEDTAHELTPGTPQIGESCLDALLVHLANDPQSFSFLIPTSKP